MGQYIVTTLTRTPGGWALNAGAWASSNPISGWKYMGEGSDVARQRGDVIAIPIGNGDTPGATGHCGIAVDSSKVVAAGATSVSEGKHGLEKGTVRRYTGS